MTIQILLQHIIVLTLMVVFPIWGTRQMRQLNQRPTSQARIRAYAETIGVDWILLAVLFLIVPTSGLLFTPTATNIAILGIDSSVIYGFIVGVAISLVVFTALAWFVESIRSYVQQMMKGVESILPQNSRERWTFAAVAVTAGICEEVIFRGFLLHYLHVQPFTLNIGVSVLLAALIFGLAHLYQGLQGIIITTIMGIFFGLLFMATGNLLLPIILHAFIDLRVLLLPLKEK